MRNHVLSQAFFSLAFLLGGTIAAQAGSFAISPVRATLSSKLSVVSLIVRNNGDEPAVIQTELLNWAQQKGHDVFTPTREVLATPPIFTVPPGGSQLIRVGMRRTPDAHRELNYRMFLQELPSAPHPGFQGLQVALRLSIPVFIVPAMPVKPVLAWKALSSAPGQIKLQATNVGNAHIQIANLKLSRRSGEELTAGKIAEYVLPGESDEWTIKSSVETGEPLRLFAKTDGGDIESEIILEAP